MGALFFCDRANRDRICYVTGSFVMGHFVIESFEMGCYVMRIFVIGSFLDLTAFRQAHFTHL